MNLNEVYAIREWAPCSDIIERIPTTRPPRMGISLFTKDLSITCLAAVDNFLALGTDGGIIYWYNRTTDQITRLDPETTSAHISCLRIVNSVEYIVAAGDTSGKVHVFQIQKNLPPDLELVVARKPIERYVVRDLHVARLTCCEWSRNGMKLFSGDMLGVVVFTEFDYQKHLSRSMIILSEAYEIVQLSVHKQHLLVCTLYRAAICCYDKQTDTWNLWQVGRKDRKQLEDCGGILMPSAFGPPRVISVRPGQRFWLSDLEGNVEKTLLFKNALDEGPNWQIPLLNPKQGRHLACQAGGGNFRQLQLFDNQQMLLVTHDGSSVFILNLESLCVEAAACGFRAILDICVHEQEIFVLEGGRTLVRLAAQPVKPNRSSRIIFNPIMPPLLPTTLGLVADDNLEQPLEVSGADECLELPPIEELSLNVPIELALESPRSHNARRLEIFNKISHEDFDNAILHAHASSVMDITDAELGKPRQQTKQRKKSQESTNRQAVDNGGKSNGIVEIGKIALHQDTNDSSNTTNYGSLSEAYVEYIPPLFETIAMGEPQTPSAPNGRMAEPQEFSDINSKKHAILGHKIDEPLKSEEPVLPTSPTRVISDEVIDELITTLVKTPAQVDIKATISDVTDTIHTSSDWEFLNN